MNASAESGSNPPPNAFPENELPKWLLRHSVAGVKRTAIALRPPPYQQLARFSHDFGTCVRSSADLLRGLELCLKPLRNTPIGDRWTGAVGQIRTGSTLADALSPAEDLLPPFFLPVINAGERSGRLDEAFSFLESHCKLLAGPASALRNVWLFPLAIMLCGSVIKVVLYAAMGSILGALSLLVLELFSYLQLAVIVVIAVYTPVRYFIDQLRLSLPLIGPLEREIAVHRFFRVLGLVYSVGGHRVELMIQMAAKSVSNNAARLELLKAAQAIEEHATIPDAFRRVSILTADEKATIEVGEMSGALEQTFNQISDDTGASMIAKLNILQPILVRIVMVMVVLSIIGTMLSLI